jgi:sigma-B regulation protein RsbU (phosphoserine phosphatase)
MGFKHMFMAMQIAKITEGKLLVSSAGMPFPLLFRHSDKSVIEIPLKGMPLGSFPGFNYQSVDINLKSGDTLLFYSDGLSECFNEQGESFGESRIKLIFKETATNKPEKIIKLLKDAAADWKGKSQLRDDMTLVVLQFK